MTVADFYVDREVHVTTKTHQHSNAQRAFSCPLRSKRRLLAGTMSAQPAAAAAVGVEKEATGPDPLLLRAARGQVSQRMRDAGRQEFHFTLWSGVQKNGGLGVPLLYEACAL